MPESDLRRWLRDLGLEEYASRFEEQDIEMSDLASLDREDLRELDIPLGPRKRILRAVASLSVGTWERRLLTVLSCDVVGSVALSERLDPEDYGDLLRTYRATSLRVISDHQGYLAQFSGDGVMAHFGYPQADEHSSERAALAALDLMATLSATEWPGNERVEFRIGIASGEVVIGREGGFEQVSGKTPNLAFRLQAAAAPGTVVVGALTRDLIGSAFELESLGQFTLKGLSHPEAGWRVLRENARLESRASTDPDAPVVGRESELAQLEAAWTNVRSGDGRFVFVHGEAGIGKTRLIETFLARTGARGRSVFRYICSPHDVSRRLFPVAGELRYTAGIVPDDSPETKWQKLRAEFTDDAARAVFAELLDIRVPEDAVRVPLTAERRDELALEHLVERVVLRARKEPVLVLVDDFQWSDAHTARFVERLVDAIPRERICCVAACRRSPEQSADGCFDQLASLARGAHAEEVALEPLAATHAVALVGRVGGGSVDAATEAMILANADGVPLFLEELTRSAMVARRVPTGTTGASAQRVDVPSSLQDSLTARLDLMGSAKRLAQTASVFGGPFRSEHLAAVADVTESALGSRLDELIGAEILVPAPEQGLDVLQFRHSLLREAAYVSLLRRERRDLHERVAGAFESAFPDVVDEQPDVVAYHYDAAELHADAARLWTLAGDRARARSELDASIAYLERGQSSLSSVGDGDLRATLELELTTNLGKALFVARGSGAAEVGETFARALALCDAIGERIAAGKASVLRSESSRGLWGYHFVRGDLGATVRLAGQILDFAADSQQLEFRLEASRLNGMAMLYAGRFAEAQTYFEQTLSLYEIEEHDRHVLGYGNDPAVASHIYLGKTLWFVGQPVRALNEMNAGVELANRLGHPFSQAHALAMAAMLHMQMHDIPGSRARAQATLEVINRYGDFPLWTTIARMVLAWADASESASSAAADRLAGAIADYRAHDFGIVVPVFLSQLADVYLQCDRVADARSTIDEARALVERDREGYYEAEILRVNADIARREQPADVDNVAGAYARALACANGQGAVTLALRAALGAARVFEQAGRRDEACALLEPLVARHEGTEYLLEHQQARVALERIEGLARG